MDLLESELQAAPPGSYDMIQVRDICSYEPQLADQFDLILSYQVLEHVASLSSALENTRRYLHGGGRFVARLSGALSVFSIANRLFPQGFIDWCIAQKTHSYKTFPAHYDACTKRSIQALTESWATMEVISCYIGQEYLSAFRPASAAYLIWEEYTMARGWENLATNYVLDGHA